MTRDCTTQGNVYHFDAGTTQKIDSMNIAGASRTETKKLNMLGYLWEIAYDLCLAPQSNISGSAGFENLIGEH